MITSESTAKIIEPESMSVSLRPGPAESAGGSAAIVSRLRRAILDGTYAYNERLPPERQLAADFGAARGTVREALRQLEEMNLLMRRVGSGTFVKYRRQMDQEAIANLTSPLELIDVRCGIEPQMVRLAVLNASARDLENLHQVLLRVEAASTDSEEFTQADVEFHLALAECTQNPLMVWLYQHINDIRGHAQWSKMKDKILTVTRIKEYNLQHRALYTAIVERDAAGAVELIRAHLEEARRDLLGVDL
jgi:DNA-binding FadR family transcriptional regulator